MRGVLLVFTINILQLSTHAAGLPNVAQARYIQKISFFAFDPYTEIVSFNDSDKELPPISLIDIYNYFVLKTSAYTSKQLKAYKSLESYNFFISGWITKVEAVKFQQSTVVRGEVSIFSLIFVVFHLLKS